MGIPYVFKGDVRLRHLWAGSEKEGKGDSSPSLFLYLIYMARSPCPPNTGRRAQRCAQDGESVSSL